MRSRPAAVAVDPCPPRRSPSLTSVALAAWLVGAGCAHARRTQPLTPAAAPAPVAAAPITSDEAYARARAAYDERWLDSPTRAADRAPLAAWLAAEARRHLQGNRPDEAWEALQRALSLWDVEDLRAPERDDAFTAAADELERFYRRRGAHKEVLALLGAEAALRPGDEVPARRFDEVVAWMRGADSTGCGDKSCGQVIEDLEAAVTVFPAPFFVDRLAELYWLRQDTGGHMVKNGAGSRLAELFAGRLAGRVGTDLTRLYLRASRPDLALAALDKLQGQTGEDPNLREALQRYTSPSGQALDGVALASAFHRDASGKIVGLRICRDVARRMPNAPEGYRCIAQMAVQLSQSGVAVRALERALKLQPDLRDTWEAMARLLQMHLQQIVSDERVEELEPELKRVERFHEAAHKRFPSDPLQQPLSGAYDAVARGLYNAGRVDEALRYVAKSIALAPSITAYEQRALITWKLERNAEALGYFREALAFAKSKLPAGAERAYWEARTERQIGDILATDGDTAGARAAWTAALAGYDAVAHTEREPEETAELEVERAKLHFLVGAMDKAREDVERALDAAPERGATYADTIAFFLPRGERAFAADVLHRALGRSISEYLKVYASLWLTDFDRRSASASASARAGTAVPTSAAAPDEAAVAYLEAARGVKWFHSLAAWSSGHLSEADLRARADTPAKRCEADFYIGMRRLGDAAGEPARAEAVALLRKVIDSHLMAFFEYDMAQYYLRRLTPSGAATR